MARQFSVNDRIGFGAADYLELAAEVTYMADVYLDNITQDHGIVNKHFTIISSVLFFDDVGSSGNDRFSMFIQGSLGGTNRAETDSVVANKWYRVLGRYQANTSDGIYIKLLDYSANTITKYTNAAPATTMNQATIGGNIDLTIGANANSARDAEARIGNVFAHDAVYSDSVEDLLLRSPNPAAVVTSLPRLFVPMWGDEGPAINLGTEVNGTVTGTIPVAEGPPLGRYAPRKVYGPPLVITPAAGRIMSSLAGAGGLAGPGGIAGNGGGLAA